MARGPCWVMCFDNTHPSRSRAFYVGTTRTGTFTTNLEEPWRLFADEGVGRRSPLRSARVRNPSDRAPWIEVFPGSERGGEAARRPDRPGGLSPGSTQTPL